MKKYIFIIPIYFLIANFNIQAQKIYYADVAKTDAQQTYFDIIGRMEGNVLIYTENKNNPILTIYDADMKQVSRNLLSYLPNNILHVDFIAYNQQGWAVYQFQQKNIVYCKAVAFNAMGKKIAEAIDVDSTIINGIAKNTMYTLLISEDKQKIMLLKINTKKEKDRIKENIFTMLLFDAQMHLLHKSNITQPVSVKNNYLTNFYLDNQGNVLFTNIIKQGKEDRISNVWITTKAANQDSFIVKALDLRGLYADDIKVKIDNINKKYILTSLYSKARKDNVDGLYTAFLDVVHDSVQHINTIIFNDELRNNVQNESSLKTAFNDYILQDIIVKNDGSFIVTGELLYTTSQNNNPFNQSNYLYGYPYSSAFDYYSWYAYGQSPWSRYTQFTQFHAHNIMILSVDNIGKLTWSNVITKKQMADETDHTLSYKIINTGDQLHFIFNQQERGNILLTDNSILPNGQLTRSPTLRGLDQGYTFIPRYAKQVGAKQAIIPCVYENYLSFAKIEWR